MNRRVAIIHAANVFRDWMVRILEKEGFEIGPVGETVSADEILGHDPDIVILDTDQKDNTDEGFRLCAELRMRAPEVMIAFISDSDYECDRVSAYRVGADEFFNKRVSGLFLAVRLAALLRRRANLLGLTENYADTGHNGLRLDTEEWAAHWHGEPLNLSLTRIRILNRLCQLPGQVCTPADLMAAAGIRVEPNTITAHIKAIRDEFRRIDPGFDRIRSERSVGYRWVARHAH